MKLEITSDPQLLSHTEADLPDPRRSRMDPCVNDIQLLFIVPRSMRPEPSLHITSVPTSHLELN